MQGAMDIIAMIQKSSAAKQKPSSISFGSSSEKTSFKNELAEARKVTSTKSFEKQPSETPKHEPANDNKIEKLAKVMSSSKTVTDKVDAKQAEKSEEDQKAAEVKETDNTEAVSQQEADDAVEGVTAKETTGETKQVQDEPLAELVESAQQLLQQLMQLISGSEANETEKVDSKVALDSVQALSQKLEQILAEAPELKTLDPKEVIKDLKVNLKELLTQLKTQVAEAQTTATDKPSVQQTVDTLKQLINKMNEVKPMLQQKLTNQEEISEYADLKLEPEAKQSKEIVKAANTAEEVKPQDEGVKLEGAVESNAKESTDKDSKDNEKESSYKTNSKEASKQQISFDKHKPEGFKILDTLPNNKADAEFNLKELNQNLKKEQMTTINKSDILNQVIKKADIIVREGHSEMVMKLEPESLGKLNLKIVVEKGLITAKFIAESQQVKEVLESSFNQLKDALQEKGIAVQNFSVSVGQQASDSSSNQSFNQWKQSIKIKNKAVGDFVGLDDEAIMNQNPYSIHDGKFDYRA